MGHNSYFIDIKADVLVICILLSVIIALGLSPLTSFASVIKRKVAKIEVTGNRRTKTVIILDQLTFSSGTEITDKDIETSRQNLLNMELFSEIEFKETAAAPEGEVVIEVQIKEKWSILPLPIFSRTSDAEVRTGFKYEDFNFRGRNYYLRLSSYRKWANDTETDLGVTYAVTFKTQDRLRKNLIFSTDFSQGKSLEEKFEEGARISQYIKKQDAYSFSIGRNILADRLTGLTSGITFTSRQSGYTYLDGVTQPYADADIRSLGLFLNYNNVNNVGHYTYDGYEIRFDIINSNKTIGSDVNALTYVTSFSHFIPYNGGRNLAYRLEGTLVTGERITELLATVGGSTSLRGYESGEFEGDRMFLINTEYRFPLTKQYWGGVVFLDGGNAWEQGRSIREDGLHWAAGIGLRLFVKQLVKGIGRLDFAYNVSQGSYKGYMGVHHTF